MRDSRIHRRIEDVVTSFISEYIADMSDEELYVYIKEVFLMDEDDDWIGYDAEIGINCALTAFGRASDTKNRDASTRRYMNKSFMDLSAVLERHGIITRDELKEIANA